MNGCSFQQAKIMALLTAAAIIVPPLLLSSQTSRDYKSAMPTISISRVPHAGKGGPQTEPIAGSVKGVDFAKHKVVIYTFAGGTWWVQPTVASPLTDIDGQGNWQTITHLGSTYAALLIRQPYKPPATSSYVPRAGGDVLAVNLVAGNRQGAEAEHNVQLSENLEISDHVQVSVAKAVDLWQRENIIDVTEDAKTLVEQGFNEEREDLKTLLGSQANAQVLFDAVVENYLFDVRDEKIRNANSKNRGLPVGMRSKALGLFPQGKVADSSIRSEDIRRMPPAEFIRRHLVTWTGKTLAQLHVMSNPDGAEIDINQSYSGYTCKKFVLSEGHYRVHVSPTCDQEVDVFANHAPARVSCNRVKTCSRWNEGSP